VNEPLERVKTLHAPGTGQLVRTALFELLAHDVEWQVAGSPEVLPWAGTFVGRDAVRGWLETLDEHMEYDLFEPLEFLADGDTVVEIVQAAGRANVTGRPFESEIVRVWTFRGDEAVRVRSFYDTAAYERAFTA
jgi:ketosteroid isomerase-like protein